MKNREFCVVTHRSQHAAVVCSSFTCGGAVAGVSQASTTRGSSGGTKWKGGKGKGSKFLAEVPGI